MQDSGLRSMGLSAGHGGSDGRQPFPDPWSDAASQQFPDGVPLMLRYAEYIANTQLEYREAMSRVLSYFITDVDVSGKTIGDDERDEYREFLEDVLHIRRVLFEVGVEYITYGNAFVSVILPFRRYLMCPRCSSRYPFTGQNGVAHDPRFRFSFAGFKFNASCPRCKFSGDMGRPIDIQCEDSELVVKRHSPHEIHIDFDQFTGRPVDYYWLIPPDYRDQITQGRVEQLANCPWEVIKAVEHNELFKFNKGAIFHWAEPVPAGIRARGWGIPKSIINFRSLWQLQTLRRYNEAIAADYIHPTRVITPDTSGRDAQAGEPLLNINLANFTSRVQSMLRKRRTDPGAWFVLPTPIRYTALGGDARTMAPRDLIDQQVDTVLNGSGIPVDLYKGSLQTQAAPASLRLFEMQHVQLVSGLNRVLAYISKRLQYLLSWEPVKLKLKSVQLVDDIQMNTLRLQLAQSGLVSKTTALEAVKLDYRNEIKRTMEDSINEAKEQNAAQEKMEAMDIGKQVAAGQIPGMPPPGAPPGPGMPPGGGGAAGASPAAMPPAPGMPGPAATKIDPRDLIAQAQSQAAALLSLPDAQRTSSLLVLKQQDPLLHQLVKAQMEQIRSQAASAGGQMMMSQWFPQQGAPQG